MPTRHLAGRAPQKSRCLPEWRRRAIIVVHTMASVIWANRCRQTAIRCGPTLGLFLEAVIAPLYVCMILVAREQHDCVFSTIGELAASSNLASIVDEDGLNQSHGRAGKNQRAQIYYGSAILPQERMVF